MPSKLSPGNVDKSTVLPLEIVKSFPLNDKDCGTLPPPPPPPPPVLSAATHAEPLYVNTWPAVPLIAKFSANTAVP